MPDDIPQTQCPNCGTWQDDHDGFGVMNCSRCEYCRHPTEDLVDGYWICGICRRRVREARPGERGEGEG